MTQHIQNVETLDNAGNEQLQAQLHREDPELSQAVRDREAVAQRRGNEELLGLEARRPDGESWKEALKGKMRCKKKRGSRT
ncbi:hypothetical protein PI125_g6618 [Phytophthora idaei]|nr:hypothetical protein PI125_g6618 [Phytophthora idaei]